MFAFKEDEKNMLLNTLRFDFFIFLNSICQITFDYLFTVVWCTPLVIYEFTH